MKYHLKKLVPAIIMIVHVSGIFGQFSPGDLAEKHQHLSGNQFCAECHSKGKTVDSQDCLNCHVPIRTRMDQKSGYHGGDEKMNCIKCHSDHNGDNFQMVFWENGRDNFDHSETGYKIEGKHTELTCDKCHLPKYVIDDNVINWEIATRSLDFLSTTFLGLPVQCSGCHEDVHEIKPDSREYSVFSGKLCTDCHDQSDWKNASRKFDHSTTKFPLKLSHAKQNCIKCHPNGSDPEKLNLTFYDTYEKLLCVQCHKDVHQNSYGSTCESCHNEDDWKKPFAFDHSKTKFSLKGKHIPVPCAKCHTPGKLFAQIPSCRDCHEDKHQNQFFTNPLWNDCTPCHYESGWTPSYYSISDHEKNQFPLTGAHQAIPCVFCHKIPEDTALVIKYSSLEKSCSSCHTDPHNNQFAEKINKEDCAGCHDTNDWKISPFDHNKTRYPLDGKHVNVSCEKCHKSENMIVNDIIQQVIRYKPLGIECIDCHIGKLYK